MLADLRLEIDKLKRELEEIGEPTPEIPELIESTNLMRANDHLKITNEKKSQLLAAYDQYVSNLENLVSSAFEIQNDLKELLKDQSELIKESEQQSSRRKIKKNSRKKVPPKKKKSEISKRKRN